MLIIQRPSVEAVGEPEGNRQRFTVSPLEPGFGYTLGAVLRRTLLSSIPGAAITQVRFDDSLHEFADINGTTITGYSATVSVTQQQLDAGIPLDASLRITVTVTHGGDSLSLSSYRVRYAPRSLP